MKISPFLKKIVSVFVIIVLIAPALVLPKKALAEGDIVFDPGRFIQTAIEFGIDDAIQDTTLSSTLINTAKDIITSIQTTITAAKTTYLALKEAVLDPIARLLGVQLTDMLTKQMFSFIAKGNSGAPSFVTNPQAYFGGVAQESTQVYLTDLQNNRPNMLPSIRNAVRQRIIEENYVDSKRMEQSTFPGGDAGYQAYLKNPGSCSTGNSWDCYFATLEPQNDPWQVQQYESEKLAAKRATDVQLARDEIAWGSGYHTLKDCIERDGAGSAAAANSESSLAWISFLIPQALAQSAATFPLQGQGGPSSITPIDAKGNTDGATTFPVQDQGGPTNITPIDVNGNPITDTSNGTTDGSLSGSTSSGGSTAGGMSGNCTEYLNKTPGDALAGQVNQYLNNSLKNLQNIHEAGEVITLGISGIQNWMNGSGLTSVNEVGTQGVDQGNGVTTYSAQGQGGGPTNETAI